MEGTTARSALASVDEARSAAAARVGAPRWYYPAAGVLLGVGGTSLVLLGDGGLWWMAPVAVLLFLNRFVLQPLYREAAGVWVSGVRNGVATLWTIALVVVSCGSLVVAGQLRDMLSTTWPAWAEGGVLFAGTLAYGWLFTSTLRRRLLIQHGGGVE